MNTPTIPQLQAQCANAIKNEIQYMKALLQIKFRAYESRIKPVSVTDDTTDADERIRAAFHAGAHAYREMIDDELQLACIFHEVNPPECSASLRCSLFILGVAVGSIITFAVMAFTISPN